MTPQEFYLLYETRLPREHRDGLSDADKDELLADLRAAKAKAKAR
jgi:hypothetical protein